MQKTFNYACNSTSAISANKKDNAGAKTLMHRLKIVSSDNALSINNDFVNDSLMVDVAHLPWAQRQVQSAVGQRAQYYNHSGPDCHNRIAVIGVGNSMGNSGLGQKLAENLPAITRQAVCYFDIGNEYAQIENCLAHHSHVIIANCADLTEEPALSFPNLSKLRQAQHESSNNILTTYEIKQPYVMRKGDGISTANQNIQIADELAYISLNRNLPRTWLFLINPDHEATNTILTTAKSNASLGQRSKNGASSCHQNFAPDMEAAMPRLILRLQTLINDLLVTKD